MKMSSSVQLCAELAGFQNECVVKLFWLYYDIIVFADGDALGFVLFSVRG